MKVKLGDICSFQSGGTPSKSNPAYFGGDIPWITTVALNGGWIDGDNAVDWITPMAVSNSAAKVVPAESIMVGTRVGVGKVAINRVPMATSQDIISLIGIDVEKWDKDFLCKWLQAQSTYLNSQARGATIKGIKIDVLAKLEVPSIDLSNQKRIARVFEVIIGTIELRKQQLKKLDELVKVRFVEMFGDPIVRFERGETMQLDRIAGRITVGFVGEASNDYSEDGIPYLRTQNVRVNRIDLNGLIYINESFHNRNSKSIIHPGDVVVSRVGANRGMAAVIPESLPEANIANCLIVGQTKSVNPYYLAFYLNMSFGKRPQFGASVGSAQGVINTAILKKWEVFVPDIQRQSEFNDFAQQVDKSKLSIQASLDQLETLKQSLVQKYFG